MKLLVVLLALLSISAQAEEFTVRQFGARGDGKTFDTTAIQQALDACKVSGGAVRFPPGIYLSKPLTLHSHTILQLDKGAMLLADTNQSDFLKVPGNWLSAKSHTDFTPFLFGKDLEGVTITGEGVIDGGGSAWWEEAERARRAKPARKCPRPELILFQRCKNLKIENITLQNAPAFHLVPGECENVVISHVTIQAPKGAANTDGIDPSSCRNVLITGCTIDVGDDNVAIKAARKVAGRAFASEEITVQGCRFLHGHGVSIGSETTGGVRNVSVQDCSFENTGNGLRIKSQRGRGGIVENIVCDRITMRNVSAAVTLTCVYGATDDVRNPASAENLPAYRNIRISNLTATCSQAAGLIQGIPESPISDVTLENVRISAPKPFAIIHARNIRLINTTVTVPLGSPFQLEDAEVQRL